MAVRTITKYESDSGDIHSITMSPQYAAVAGTAPTGSVNNDIKPKITKSNREYGIRPRGVRLTRTVGTGDDQFKRYTFLAVLTPTAYTSNTFAMGATITIDGTDWTVSGRISEDY